MDAPAFTPRTKTILMLLVIIAITLLVMFACSPKQVQHNGRYRTGPYQWPAYTLDSLQQSQIKH